MFEGNQQQDAHEMLGYILNLLQEIKIQAAPAAPLTGKLVFLMKIECLFHFIIVNLEVLN